MPGPDFSPPEGVEMPLWRSLLLNIIDRLAPERLPPLELTSQPVEVGLLEGDALSLPWYRTVRDNMNQALWPQKLPPLELESRPVDVGELLADELSHGWWNSLLGGLRERLAPEKLAPLPLTSHPVEGFGAESRLQILDWSDLLTTPKVFLADVPAETAAVFRMGSAPLQAPAAVSPDRGWFAARMQLVRDLGRTRFRRRIWMGVALAEIVYLAVAIFR